jgi:uncharacterized protein (TIGR02145 family)
MKKQIVFLSNFLLAIMLFASCSNSGNKNSSTSKDKKITYSEIPDNEGNVYKTVTIGTQVWLAENLKTTKYNDGTTITLVKEELAWKALKTPAYCWFNNDSSYKNVYGALYNWYTVNTNKLCPTGWHVPAVKEWNILTTYLGGRKVAGGKLKEIGLTHWQSPNKGANNETGFTALPGGNRRHDGVFYGIGYDGYCWSSTEHGSPTAYNRRLLYSGSQVGFGDLSYKQSGYSVRCLRDN